MKKIISALLIIGYCNLILASSFDDSTSIFVNKIDTLTNTEMASPNKFQTESKGFQDSLSKAKQDSTEQIAKDKKWATRKPLIITGIVFGVIGMIVLFVIMVNETKGQGQWYFSVGE